MTKAMIIQGDCLEKLNPDVFRREGSSAEVCLTFLDPPFNQGKDYDYFDDDLPEHEYWLMMQTVCSRVRELTMDGGAIYYMQREKHTEAVFIRDRN